MIKFDIKNALTGEVQFTAEIDCAEDADEGVKLGFAVVSGLKLGANLVGADLRGADLRGAYIADANLTGANLDGADLRVASLNRANLVGAKLEGADLTGANLTGANLEGAKLEGANLEGANLAGAKLEGANLYRANLYRAKLEGANLEWADINGVNGVNDYIKCIQIDVYPITYTDKILQIGCERHTLDEWRGFDDERIIQMEGKKALKFWRKYKDWVFQTIELCPAKPMNAE